MKFTKILNGVIKSAIASSKYYGNYGTFTLDDFYTKKMAIKKIININDYFDSTTSPSISDFNDFYDAYYSESVEYKKGWYSPLIICVVDKDNNFWSFDSFYNNVVNWTIEGPLTIPEKPSEVTTFLTAWSLY